MRAILGLLVIVTSAACEGTPFAPEFDVLINLEDSVVARRGVGEVNLLVNVRLKNNDARPLFYDNCGHVIQRRLGNNWQPVFRRPCLATQYSEVLAQGESRIFDFRARAPVNSSEWPAMDAPGEYRVVLFLSAVPKNQSGFGFRPLGPASRTSPVFSVREEIITF